MKAAGEPAAFFVFRSPLLIKTFYAACLFQICGKIFRNAVFVKEHRFILSIKKCDTGVVSHCSYPIAGVTSGPMGQS